MVLFLGSIADVLQTGANDVYVVRPNPGMTQSRQILIPVIDDVVLEIAPSKGYVLIRMMEGLLD